MSPSCCIASVVVNIYRQNTTKTVFFAIQFRNPNAYLRGWAGFCFCFCLCGRPALGASFWLLGRLCLSAFVWEARPRGELLPFGAGCACHRGEGAAPTGRRSHWYWAGLWLFCFFAFVWEARPRGELLAFGAGCACLSRRGRRSHKGAASTRALLPHSCAVSVICDWQVAAGGLKLLPVIAEGAASAGLGWLVSRGCLYNSWDLYCCIAALRREARPFPRYPWLRAKSYSELNG